MTFRELAVGDWWRYPEGAVDHHEAERRKVSKSAYSVNGWVHHVEPSKRDFEVIRIEAPKEGEK